MLSLRRSTLSRSIKLSSTVLGLATALWAPSARAATDVITNGGFETGNLAGWSVTNVGSGDVFVLPTGSATPTFPPSGPSFNTATNPSGGSFFAVTASDNPGAHALLRNFSLAGPQNSVVLNFDLFANDQSGVGPIVDPSGLDPAAGGTPVPRDNQHARVDVLSVASPDLSTNPTDVLFTAYLGVDNPGGATPNPWKHYSFDLTSLMPLGGTFRLRFAEVDNLGALNLGVDNVSVMAQGKFAPEGGGVALSLLASLPLAPLLRRRRVASRRGPGRPVRTQ
jgi:hypothetical protein